jgi:hypothetical protein
MTTTAAENLPAMWDDARDLPCYDDGPVDTVELAPAQHRSSTTALAGVDDRPQLERDLMPVRVRRIG